MSWGSRALNFLLNSGAGKPADAQIIMHPTTGVEAAINSAAAVLLPIAAAVPGVQVAAVPLAALKQVISTPGAAANAAQSLTSRIGQSAHSMLDLYLEDHIGAQDAQLMDVGLEALFSIGVGRMSAANGKSPNDIADAVHDFLNGYLGTAPAQPVTLPAG